MQKHKKLYLHLHLLGPSQTTIYLYLNCEVKNEKMWVGNIGQLGEGGWTNIYPVYSTRRGDKTQKRTGNRNDVLRMRTLGREETEG